jgi:hypothetical protein
MSLWFVCHMQRLWPALQCMVSVFVLLDAAVSNLNLQHDYACRLLNTPLYYQLCIPLCTSVERLGGQQPKTAC